MIDQWTRTKLLIIGQTYPSYSQTHRENVCTGALLPDTSGLVRVHPIPKHYLAPGQGFRDFQWIEADVAKHQGDPRPESLKIRPDTIRPLEVMEVARKGGHEARRALLDRSPHLHRSVEELRDANGATMQSLGIVRPKTISGVKVMTKPDEERVEWLESERKLEANPELFEAGFMRIDFIPVSFKVCFECDDLRCTGHEMKLAKWGVHELWRKYAADPEDANAKVRDQIERMLNLDERDPYFFLGTFRGHMTNFGLMDIYSPPKVRQPTLFG